jgi:transposase
MKRKKRKSSAPVFKEYNQEQGWLFPPSLNEMVPENHVVRVVDRIIRKIDITPLLRNYKGGGTSSYHPEMMLKLVVYAYSQRVYSSRQIAKAARENIHFMWLTGSSTPDFRTINRFRSSRLKGTIDEIFYSVIEVLHESGYINLDDYFLDGTKIEANANKYTWVWKKSTHRYKGSLEKKVKALLVEIDEISDEENKTYGDKDLEEMGEEAQITAEDIEQKVKEIDERLAEDPENKKLKKAKKTMQNDYLPRMKKYEEQEAILQDRNSFSKTDHDATFMRMKDDHMRNGQLKPAYNVQIGTENQFIVGYSIHQKPTDTVCMISHLEHIKEQLGRYPSTLIADAGYGGEENYSFLDASKIRAFVKFNFFHKEQKKKFLNNPYRRDNLRYDIKTDSYLCPAGKHLTYKETEIRTTKTGFESQVDFYQCEDCSNCSLRNDCHSSKDNRKISIRPLLEYYKTEERKMLKSAEGKKYRSLRPIEPESVYGQIKWNRGFKRFLLRGIDKIHVEWGLVSLAHNMLKIPT